jgi:predicted metal-dependent hydrolase
MSERGVAQLLARQQDWIAAQRHRQVPRLGLERLGVSKSEARIAAREVISALAEEEAPRIGVRYQRLRIGDQRTLWGSCSARGTISFNWRLVLTSPEVLDYVVVHELCHLHVLDHSARFWQRVARYRPQWREQRDWLREHGAELLALDPAD